MAKKKSKKMNLLLSIITAVVGIASFVPLLLDTWGGFAKIGDKASEVEAIGGYFTDYSDLAKAFELADSWLAPAFSIIAGIAVCVATALALLFVVGVVLNCMNKDGSKLCKLASIGLLISAIVIAISSIIFVLPTISATGFESHIVMMFAGYLGFIIPAAAGVLGLISTK
ncbi:MAG: hypothetical protein IJA61_00630 [Clostridia bacterium]|nr:hypothetical protein [Clostridia bacterium]